jgi:hypothetical protein
VDIVDAHDAVVSGSHPVKAKFLNLLVIISRVLA